MRQTQKDGHPLRQHWEAAVRMGRKTLEELEGPPIPPQLDYLFDWLLELDRARDHGMGGPKPFSYPQLESWARLTGREPEPHEVEALIYLGLVLAYPPADEKEG